MTKPIGFSKEIKQAAVREYLETHKAAAVAKKYGRVLLRAKDFPC